MEMDEGTNICLTTQWYRVSVKSGCGACKKGCTVMSATNNFHQLSVILEEHVIIHCLLIKLH